jgi:hypothetical protein
MSLLCGIIRENKHGSTSFDAVMKPLAASQELKLQIIMKL